MSSELEAAAADALSALPAKRRRPPPGAQCANCGATLLGPFCYECGQTTDNHKRSIFHLCWEVVEDMSHLDGRLLRTIPDLFLRPGRLAKDYMDGRIARHVPPFRTFLVALLLFIFAAEHAAHEEVTREAERKSAMAATLATPQGRAAEASRQRTEAAQEHVGDLAEAAKDRQDGLKDPDEKRDRVEADYAREAAKADVDYAIALDKADRIAKGLPPETSAQAASHAGVSIPKKRQHWWTPGLNKATANPEYYWTVLFTWGHRMAVLLLPIIGLTLALVYRNRPRYYVYDHMLVAMNLLSFAFVTNAVGFVLPMPLMGPWLGLVALWTPVNMFQTLRGAYGSSLLGAALKTLFVWTITVFSFAVLLLILLVFTLGQL